MKSTIKTVQPYKLYKKFIEAKRSVKKGIFGALILIVIMCNTDPGKWLLAGLLILLAFPVMFYNPALKSHYEPGKTYSWVKDLAEGRRPNFLIKALPILGIVAGATLDFLAGVFPVFTILFGAVLWGYAFVIKKKPEWFEDKYDKKRRQEHQDVDYNVKVDLNDIYGINDKMTLSYQNFHFDQKHLEKGDYLLGVSPLGVYFAHKLDSVNKTFIKFEDIDTLGLLAAIGNKFIFNIKSKSNIEISIIIDQDDSLVVSPYKLLETLLNTLDSFLLNGGVGTTPTTRRRRITVSPSSTDSTINKTDDVVVDTGRSIELETTTEGPTDKQSTNTNRVVDISFTETVIAELAAGEMITSNRQIEI